MMISCIRRRTVLVAVFATLLSTAASATAPRAWLVSKGNTQAVLVGESHVGTPVENDRYFETVVKPGYAAAEVAVMETYFAPEQLRNASFALGAPCFDDPMGLHTQRLHRAFDDLTRTIRDSHLEVPNWVESWVLIPQYLAWTSLDTFTTASLGPAYGVHYETGVSFRLRGKGTTSKKTIGLDMLEERRTHFCSASAADRADFVADKVLQASRLLRLKQSDPLFTSFSKLAVVAGESADETIRCVDRPVPCAIDSVSPGDQILQDKGLETNYSPGTFEIMIKQRTHAWVPRIAKTISEHRRTFVIVGALHLPDLRVGNRVEPGLISLLRQQGFSVTSIGRASDIGATFLSPSWFDRVRAALGNL
jgi:TraB/PrgY/gumN family